MNTYNKVLPFYNYCNVEINRYGNIVSLSISKEGHSVVYGSLRDWQYFSDAMSIGATFKSKHLSGYLEAGEYYIYSPDQGATPIKVPNKYTKELYWIIQTLILTIPMAGEFSC